MNPLMIGEGQVFHSRQTDVITKFVYPTFFLHFNVDFEADLRIILRRKFFNIFTLRASDYLNGQARPLGENIRAFLKERVDYDAEEIWLQTMPRMLGYGFNPVNFWILKRAGDCEAVLCEVNNTFGEHHFYWIHAPGKIESEWHHADKVFHVSPFQPTLGHYDFRFRFSDDQSSVDINYRGADQKMRLITWIKGKLAPVEEKSLAALVFRYGWMTPLVVFRIHYQAVKLWLNKVPYIPKPSLPVNEVTR